MVSEVKDELERRILETALRCVSDSFGITQKDILSASRKRPVVYARHAYCALVVHEYNSQCIGQLCITYGRIGGFIDRDHATAMYSAKSAHKKLADSRNKEYSPLYDEAAKNFRNEIGTIGNAETRIRLSQIKIQEKALIEERERLMSFKRK